MLYVFEFFWDLLRLIKTIFTVQFYIFMISETSWLVIYNSEER